MFRASRALFPASLFFSSICIYGAAINACDLNADGVVNAVDVQAAINMSIGLAPCTANIAGANVCNVVIVQRVVSASLPNGTCLTSTGIHTVLLSWSASAGATSYKVYRGTTQGSYSPLLTLGNVTSFMDTTVVSGQTYYYVVTAVNSNGESGNSSPLTAVVPNP